MKKKKKTEEWSIPISSQDTTLLLYPVVTSCGDPFSAHSNTLTFFPIKLNEQYAQTGLSFTKNFLS